MTDNQIVKDKGKDYITLYTNKFRVEFRCHWLCYERLYKWFDVIRFSLNDDSGLSKLTIALLGFEVNIGVYK